MAAGIAGLLMSAALAGCSDSGSDEGPGSSGTSGAPSESAKSASPSASSASPVETPASVRNGIRALKTAQGAVSGSKAYDIEHDDAGERDWEVKLAGKDGKQHEVRVSDSGGKVDDKWVKNGRDDDAAKLKGTKVTLADAVRKASERQRGEELLSAEIDRNRKGATVWQVHTMNPASASPDAGGDSGAAETETVLDASTGKVLSERADD